MAKEKGNVIPIILILILIVGLIVAVYLVQKQTNIFPKAYFPTPSQRPATTTQSQYQNPFDQSGQNKDSSTIFSGYQNPFENLK